MVNERREEKTEAGVRLEEAEEAEGQFFKRGRFPLKNGRLRVPLDLGLARWTRDVLSEEVVANVLRLGAKSTCDMA